MLKFGWKMHKITKHFISVTYVSELRKVLKNLKQTDSFQNYQIKFLQIVNKLELSEGEKLSRFIDINKSWGRVKVSKIVWRGIDFSFTVRLQSYWQTKNEQFRSSNVFWRRTFEFSIIFATTFSANLFYRFVDTFVCRFDIHTQSYINCF